MMTVPCFVFEVNKARIYYEIWREKIGISGKEDIENEEFSKIRQVKNLFLLLH